MNQYKVLLTDDATQDLKEIYHYISYNDQTEKADYVLNNIEKIINRLKELPDRGKYPPELAELGIIEYREVFFKPYRIIYRTTKKVVYIYLIVDGRRNMKTLLERRLLMS